MEQEELIAEHLLNQAQLYVAPGERERLVRLVERRHPGHQIAAAEIDLENVRWNLQLVTVTN